MRSVERDFGYAAEWKKVQLVAGWIEYSTSDTPYFRVKSGYLDIVGAAKSGNTASVPIGYLPGVRLAHRLIFPVIVNSSAQQDFVGALVIQQDGFLQPDWPLIGSNMLTFGLHVPLI